MLAMMLMASASAYAQATGTKPFEPQVGQAGKDVVWVPTSLALVNNMLDLAKATSELAVMAAQISALRKFRQKK